MKNARIGNLGFSTLLLFFWIIGLSARAQYREIGVTMGGMAYSGDLTQNYDLTSNRLGGSIFYRVNITNPVSIRYSMSYGRLIGNDDDPIDVAAQLRGASFDINVLELSAMMEYYFLDYKGGDARVDWSPYFFIGAGVFRVFGNDEKVTDYSSLQPVIPFGLGVEYDLGERFNLGFEFGARKLFFDFLDNVSGGDPTIKNYQYGNSHDRDWYYSAGLTLTYTLYSVPCYYRFY